MSAIDRSLLKSLCWSGSQPIQSNTGSERINNKRGNLAARSASGNPRTGLHIALATTAEVDLLVSWNFKHIVHYDKIRMFNAVNLELGYKPLQIYSPREVTHHGEERD